MFHDICLGIACSLFIGSTLYDYKRDKKRSDLIAVIVVAIALMAFGAFLIYMEVGQLWLR